MRKIMSLLAAACLAATATIVGITPAANAETPSVNTQTSYKVTVTARQYNYVNTSQLLGSRSGNKGVTCSISKSASATRTVSTSLGISRGAVSSNLGISAATSSTVTVQCSGKITKAGQSLKAYPKGTKYTYTVTKTTTFYGKKSTTTTKGLTAFNPNDIYCKLS